MLNYSLSKILSLSKDKYILFLIFIIALVLRLWGITHGFPHIWSIDEPALVRSSYGLRFDLNPGHFDWPHFYYYVNGFFYFLVYSFRVLVNRIGLGQELQSVFPLLYKDPTVFYFISRVLNAFVGAFTAIIMYKVSKNLFSTKIAFIAATLMAILPYHVEESHKALLEPALVLTMLLVFYYSLKIIDKPILKNFILAGVFIGLSTSIKYNGFLSAIPVILATLVVILRLLPKNPEKLDTPDKSGQDRLYGNDEVPPPPVILSLPSVIARSLRRGNLFKTRLFHPQTAGFAMTNKIKLAFKFLFISALVSILVFFLTTPYALLDYKTFFRSDVSSGAFWQFENVGKNPITQLVPNLWSTLTQRIPQVVTYPVWILSILGYLLAIYYKKTKLILLGSFMFAYIFYTSTLTRQPTHYFLPIFTLLVILASNFFSQIYKIAGGKVIQNAILILVISVSFYSSVQVSRAYASIDTRNLATDWISENVKSGTIFFDGEYKPLILDKKVLLKSPDGLITESVILNTSPDYFIWTKYTGSPTQENYYQPISDKIEKVIYFSGEGNLGPDIYIYKVTR